MVTQFTNCDGCANKPGCMIKSAFNRLCESTRTVDFVYSPITDSDISINIKCNKYQTDYGKGLGKQ